MSLASPFRSLHAMPHQTLSALLVPDVQSAVTSILHVPLRRTLLATLVHLVWLASPTRHQHAMPQPTLFVQLVLHAQEAVIPALHALSRLTQSAALVHHVEAAPIRSQYAMSHPTMFASPVHRVWLASHIRRQHAMPQQTLSALLALLAQEAVIMPALPVPSHLTQSAVLVHLA